MSASIEDTPVCIKFLGYILETGFKGYPLICRYSSIKTSPRPSIGLPEPLKTRPNISLESPISTARPDNLVRVLFKDKSLVPSNT